MKLISQIAELIKLNFSKYKVSLVPVKIRANRYTSIGDARKR